MPNPTPTPTLTDPLTVTDAATLIQIDPSVLRRAIKRGRVAATRVGAMWLIERAEAERYRDSERRPGPRRRAAGA